jgi:hypothetical protein
MLGKCSVVLILAMPVLFTIGSSFGKSLYPSIPAGKTILEDINHRPALAITMIAGMASGISAFLTGLPAVLQKKERSLLVYIATIVGLLLIFFLAGEILSPL